ncbi:penicillin acylase family protein [Amaricoccus sp.]|uniref:penicillin acylase family protein n=1 Tax=Amaricoccus sp. TaxID=1872485 RepID=UPI001B708600|nr:penicillin acylase family protein [Amaricoccus sp.]MBP7000632.1 penicillin acylase family protein [Amaricoccus sp.]
MAFLFRWLMRAVVAMAVLAGLALGLGYYLASRSLPDYDRTLTLAGLRQKTEIVRDRNAVPHILATDDHDAFFALGLVHAQDRLWQMTLMRRTAQGRLSELFGVETLEIDRLMRALDLYPLAQAAVAVQDPQARAALEAYAEGVNAWLGVVQSEALGRGAPEFFLFDAQIAPWTPADSLAILKLMALQLTDKAARETLRAQLLVTVPPERVRDVMPDSPNAPLLGLPDFGAALAPGAPVRHAALRHSLDPTTPAGTAGSGATPAPGAPVRRAALRHPLDPTAPVGAAGASNAFAAAPRRTAGGAPLLATDPHLALTAPSIWMLARIDLASGPVIGGTIPGMPLVLIGRNPDLGWGLTSSYLDDQDVFIERIDPDDPARYLTPEGWAPFVERQVQIGVKDAGPVAETLRWTRHGPVLPPDAFGVAAVTPPGHVASLGWTALTEDDRSMSAGLALMRATSVRAARAAVRDFVAPSLMLTLADRSEIALQMGGRAPARDPASASQGAIPAAGWLAANDWKGFRPYESNPWVLDPPGGVVVNTNNRLTDAAFPDNLSFDWGDSHRIIRAERLLNARAYHTLDSFIEIQTDTVSEAARTLLPLIARDLWYSGEPAAAGTVERRRQAALERLANWTGEMSEHTPEPLIYAAWIRALQRRLIVDELGPLAESLPAPDPVFLERVFRNVEGASVWCDVVQTTAVETCVDTARMALDEALIEIEARFGTRMESWRWGDAHQAVHRHQTLGGLPVLRYLVNIRQSTPGGDHTLLRGLAPGFGPEPYLNLHAAGLRAVYDFSDPDASVFVIATGESGHLLSRHYDDLAALWRRSEYVPMSLDPALARAGAVGVTTLLPAGG